MRLPWSWLAEYVDLDLEPERLAERLTLLGMEVQGIERRGADWQNVVVGELLDVQPHPRAERLWLTRVTVGRGEPLDIVCGATNISAGQRVPVALAGATLPGGRRIERTEKKGAVSEGMLCSGDELGLTTDAEGILILPPDAPLGSPLADLFGDVVLDVDVKPNRGDALSLIGVAREVSAITGALLRWPDLDVVEAGRPTAERLSVEVEDETLCPRFVGRWVDGVSVGVSPLVVQMRLLAAGQRPISNVVDASNYAMLELGKPIHTFDAAAVRGGRIVVRRARAGDCLETLDHVARELTADTLLIADPDGPLAIAGVMGGAASEVSGGTRDVIVESAIFDPVSIRRTALRYGLRSEASLRFEKGQEPRLARIGADRTAALIVAWAGGSVAPGRVDSAPAEPAPLRVAFRPARVNRLLGTSIPAGDQAALLARVGIETSPAEPDVEVRVTGGAQPLLVRAAPGEVVLQAIVPTWRRDIAIEADVTEEIARVHGYDRVPETLPDTTMPAYRPSPVETRDALREALVGAGLTEVVTHALVSERHLELAGWRGVEPAVAGDGAGGGAAIAVSNPLSQDHAWLRQGLVGSLLDVVATNVRRGRSDVAIFEAGKGYGLQAGAAVEWWRLGLALTGPLDAPNWSRPPRNADLADAKGLVEALCRRLGLVGLSYEPLTDEPLLHPGRAARVAAHAAGGALALSGRVGEVHPDALEAWELRIDRCVVAELAIAGLAAGQLPAARPAAPPRHPAVTRDVAIVVDDAAPASAVEAAVRSGAGALLEDIVLFDVYVGLPLEPGERSLAYRLTFRAADRTLTEDDVESAVGEVVNAVSRDVKGRIRR